MKQTPVRKKFQNIKHVIAIASAKGGVGKSTVTGMLALFSGSEGFIYPISCNTFS
jgi:Mrp family chromosome partitioning ATPase